MNCFFPSRVRLFRGQTLRRYSSTLNDSVHNSSEAAGVTFKRLGVPASVAATLRDAFPHISGPTKSQAELIPAILAGKDVLLKGNTGTGKTFGVILALLSDFRVWRSPHEAHKAPVDPSISTLIVVPHRDLAYQLYHWIQLFAESKIQAIRPPLPSIVQVLVRSSTTSLETQLAGLRSVTPNIVIGTPQVLLENYENLKLHRLNCVVVDEVDYLIETVPKLNDPFKRAKLEKKIKKHPGPTRELLKLVLAPRIALADGGKPLSHKPQLVLCSATLRSHLNRFLFQQSKWLTRGDQFLVKLKAEDIITANSTGLSNVSHSVLVVSQDGKIRNIDGAVAPNSEQQESEPIPITESFDTGGESTNSEFEDESEYTEDYATPPSWNPAVLEAISICFALDVPCVALMVVPPSAPVQRLVQELRKLEVNAEGLDLRNPTTGQRYLLHGKNSGSEEEPTLLVSTLASTRGLDLPALSHVFIVGVPAGRMDSYVHMSGRTGRFGKPGRVITVVEKQGREVISDEGVREIRGAEKMMKNLLKEMGITPTKVEHFE